MDNDTSFSLRIKELRDSLNMSQAEFAKSVGTTQTTLSSYETKNKTPSLEIIKEIAIKYNVSLDWLCGLCDNNNSISNLSTYAEVISLLLTIIDNTSLDSGIVFLNSPDEYDFPPIPEPYKFPYFYINDQTIRDFFIEWKELYALIEKGTIKRELYQLWLNDKLQTLSIPISSQNSIAEMGLPFN